MDDFLNSTRVRHRNYMYGGWGEFHNVSWITSALGLFALSGVIWAAFLIRAQGSMVRIAETSLSEEITGEFRYHLKRWYFWGGIATILPIVSLGLMIFKPTLW